MALGVATLGAAVDADVPLLPPGLHERTLAHPGAPAINYAIVVPAGLSATSHVPLVLALHYGGEPFDGAGRGVIELLVTPALGALGAVIVAPDALEAGWDRPVNQDAALYLLDRVAQRYATDPRRTVVTGFSMGGTGAWQFAARHPDRFSAALPVAGRPPSTSGAWRVPVFAVSSRRDTVVPMAAAVERIAELKRGGANAEMVILDAPTHFQTSAHTEGLARAVPWLAALWAH